MQWPGHQNNNNNNNVGKMIYSNDTLNVTG